MWEEVKWPISAGSHNVQSGKGSSDTLTVVTRFEYGELYPLLACITNTMFLKLVLLRRSGKRNGQFCN